MSRRFTASLFAFAVLLAGGASRCMAETVPVPNASFESPLTPYVSVNVDSWQKAPKPDWYVESDGFAWSYNVGLFKNTPTNSADHIENCDGNQAIWLFVVPEMALFQDYDSIDWRSSEPSHVFDAVYEPGKSYQLAVSVIGTGGGMQPGATLELALYYRDANSNQVTVAALGITNTPSVFSNNTHFVDFQLTLPMVKTSDRWAGKHIGIRMLSTVTTDLQGGYWDLDNVRLTSILEPVIGNPRWTNGQFEFTVRSEPGLPVEILSSTDLALPLSGWDSLGSLTNSNGAISFVYDAPASGERFYRARRVQ